MGMHSIKDPLLLTEMKTLSLRRNSHHRLHWKLSFWQLPVQPATIISTFFLQFSKKVISRNQIDLSSSLYDAYAQETGQQAQIDNNEWASVVMRLLPK